MTQYLRIPGPTPDTDKITLHIVGEMGLREGMLARVGERSFKIVCIDGQKVTLEAEYTPPRVTGHWLPNLAPRAPAPREAHREQFLGSLRRRRGGY